ncbi:MAG: hypothetical protein JWQ09_6077 [Segetibacter sp.]|nr:hypothetical protein [Segetibacter sp.]
MNCDNDFYVRYARTYVKVKPFCESSEVHYKVYLHENEVKLQMVIDEGGVIHWREPVKGETSLARELGKLIEEQQKESPL